MIEQLVELETAKLAKEKGFDELCYYAYEGISLHKTYSSWKNSDDPTEIAVPTQALLQKWLRDNFKINVFCIPHVFDSIGKYYYCQINQYTNPTYSTEEVDTYENALEKGLLIGLKMIESKNPSNDWVEVPNKNVRKFQLHDEPEIIYVIRTGFSLHDTTTPDYIVVHEDAYQQNLGKTEMLSEKEVFEKYAIRN